MGRRGWHTEADESDLLADLAETARLAADGPGPERDLFEALSVDVTGADGSALPAEDLYVEVAAALSEVEADVQQQAVTTLLGDFEVIAEDGSTTPLEWSPDLDLSEHAVNEADDWTLVESDVDALDFAGSAVPSSALSAADDTDDGEDGGGPDGDEGAEGEVGFGLGAATTTGEEADDGELAPLAAEEAGGVEVGEPVPVGGAEPTLDGIEEPDDTDTEAATVEVEETPEDDSFDDPLDGAIDG